MKKFKLTIFILFVPFIIFSQSDAIQKIRTSYNDVQQTIKAEIEQNIPENNLHVTLNQNMPAIGAQTIDLTFYFSLYQDDIDYDGYHVLNFATKKYNVAASLFMYEEFLFDGNGNLIFYYSKVEDYTCKEYRCYFENNKLIKIIIKEVIEDGNCEKSSDYKQIYESKNKVPDDYKDSYNQIFKSAERIKAVFKTVDEKAL